MAGVTAGLFGLSHPHSRAHLKTLLSSDQVSSIVLYDEDEHLLQTVLADIRDKKKTGYSDLSQLFDAEKIDFGIACFRNDANPDLCLKLIEQGIHVLSEKPIGISAQAVEQVVVAAEKAHVQLGVMYQNRYHPTSQEARSMIADGAIGQVTACESRMVTSQVKFRNPKHWLFNKMQSGGGILSWLGCHYIDLLCYTMGDDIVSVSGMVDTLSGEDIDVEDVASLSFRFKNGALGGMQAGYQLALSKAGYIGPNYDTYLGFRGTLGRVFWEPTGTPPSLHLESMAAKWQTAPQRSFAYTLPSVDAYGGAYGVAFLHDFIAATQGNGTPPASGKDALKVARFVEAAYRASETGQRVDL
jgi:predicted dehydrogenase